MSISSPRASSFNDWYSHDLGQALEAAEAEGLRAVTGRMSGQVLLQLGCARQGEVIRETGFVHRWAVDTDAFDSGRGAFRGGTTNAGSDRWRLRRGAEPCFGFRGRSPRCAA